jgi:outer membrane receptor protein involved in Fe transport
MKRILLSLLFLAFFAAQMSAQIIEGKVVDKDGMPLIDAYVFKNNGMLHAHTNELGIFYCESKPGDTLNISYLGYKTKVLVLEQKHFEKPTKIVLEEIYFDLGQIVVSNSVRSLHQVSKIDLLTSPVNSSQEILRKVPGLFIGQHAGGGKAEQLFLRGFDIDHGTDVSISVDGMPVNMVSHAHGQGYADLHFLIPETVERLDFGKGPYYTEHGNFTTAGYVDFQTKEKLDNSQFGVEFGQFNTSRLVGLFDLLGNAENQNAYIATEYLLTDGPFESPQNFNRFNLLGKYTVNLANNDKLSVLASHFTSKWDASGQIPQRAVDAGLISRFGSIDDTEGGTTSRTNFAVNHTKTIGKDAFVKSKAYFSKYDFELFSNFTFFLDDPINGDQIRQHEDRQIFGLESVLHRQFGLDATDVNLQAGVGLRYDKINNNELSHTANRKTTLEQIAFGNVNESNMYAFANLEFEFGKILLNPGLRVDYFQFDYVNNLVTNYQTLSENKAIASPKLNLIYNPSHHWQLYLKTGMGFHSNDTRVVVAQSGKQILPAAYGADLGAIWKPIPRLWVNTALWYLFLEQEFVYVGDAGVVEPSGRTRRTGVDVGLRYQLSDYLFFDADLNYTYARSIDEPEGADRIPLAPDLTAMCGLSMSLPMGLKGSLRSRFLKDRPANEDNSLVAKGYLITDVNLTYSIKNLSFGFVVENLFDVDWNETQFATESRLQNEPMPVEEIHFTPGTPFFLKGKLGYKF